MEVRALAWRDDIKGAEDVSSSGTRLRRSSLQPVNMRADVSSDENIGFAQVEGGL